MMNLNCVVACALGLSGTALAAPFVHEPFNYTVGAGASGQNGGTGFLAGSSWAYSEAATSTSTGTIAAGLTFSDLPVSGGSLLLSVVSSSSSGFSDTVNLKRRPASVPNGTTDEFWTRYLFREGVNRPNVDSFMAGLTIDDAETFAGYHKFGSWALSGNTNDRGGLSVNTTITAATSHTNLLTDSNVYMLIARYTNINAPSGVARVGTWWALSAADYDAIKAGGITEAELNATHSQYATATVMPTAAQPLNFTTSDLFDFRGIRPAVSNAFEYYYFDELYSGTTLGDLGLPVPSPGAVVFVAAMAAMSASRRRR